MTCYPRATGLLFHSSRSYPVDLDIFGLDDSGFHHHLIQTEPPLSADLWVLRELSCPDADQVAQKLRSAVDRLWPLPFGSMI
jgi:hypothetical protein